MIEIPAVIDKCDITPTHKLVGRVNRTQCIVDGEKWPAKTLVFKGFKGRRCPGVNPPPEYHGVHCFDKHVVGESCDTLDFADIPHFNKPPVGDATPAIENEVSDELHGDDD